MILLLKGGGARTVRATAAAMGAEAVRRGAWGGGSPCQINEIYMKREMRETPEKTNLDC